MQVSFRAALVYWLQLGFTSFGGPAGQIAALHREVVERRRWIDEERFAHALNFCMLLPGPEAQQLATYIGWLLHGRLGGVVAGALFVLPSALLLWGLSWLYVAHGEVPMVAAAFAGLQAAVLALIAGAIPRLARRSCRRWQGIALALFALASSALHWLPFPALVLVGAAFGAFALRPAAALTSAPSAPVSLASTLRVALACLLLWWLPVGLAGILQGWDGVLVQQGLFFSETACVTFGGAYAVLPHVAERAVERFGWLSAPEMLDGLGLAETTPGPLIMVVQFVAFLGGWRAGGALSPLASATLCAALVTWVTFLPCFLWIFVGAPYIERLRSSVRLAGALAGITATVVGVVGMVALWFGAKVLVDSRGELDAFALGLALAAFGALAWKKVPSAWVVVACAGIGVLRGLALGK
ncbi:MAG: chromate efflux transporter [Planctomycetes bacterium]|nr:chromate efflux transporter [Planctomycetota bacterium]